MSSAVTYLEWCFPLSHTLTLVHAVLLSLVTLMSSNQMPLLLYKSYEFNIHVALIELNVLVAKSPYQLGHLEHQQRSRWAGNSVGCLSSLFIILFSELYFIMMIMVNVLKLPEQIRQQCFLLPLWLCTSEHRGRLVWVKNFSVPVLLQFHCSWKLLKHRRAHQCHFSLTEQLTSRRRRD